MGLIKESRDIDYYFENRELTEEECRLISEYIKSQKIKKTKSIKQPLITLKKKKVETLKY
ncbi:MAG: hypothetical protein A2275_17925 [Bacteroidetes bacterium RIFOXYA12_FULL_35_11]|nr:MAG: hypothetical protein A2X01_19055 [Bacteroidetes bacterium GWF2_35_48]OFY78531.1 MAG: hypothetical protein A2275_17925 [Bacteroidetes bacterium RIFOXYA12_FULL_35_11]OFY99030.1 MAG: hypothetical protein A2491_15360 [Bacteroidetes bacterium RIFOXYC12_FULL_35_7]HBX50735.1 hypothetical protein [Bacteroidales bacterium]